MEDILVAKSYKDLEKIGNVFVSDNKKYISVKYSNMQ